MLGGILGKILGPLLKTGFPLMKNVLTPLAKSVLISSSATDAAIQKKISRSGMTMLIISNEKMVDIMKIVKSPEESGLLKKIISKQLKLKQNNKKVYFLVCY